MNSHVTKSFRRLFAKLPEEVQMQAREAYRHWLLDQLHPGLHFKRIHRTRPIFSVRISRDYRAIGLRSDGDMYWFWIGSHAEYDRVIASL